MVTTVKTPITVPSTVSAAIVPTVGRKIWYFPCGDERDGCFDGAPPMAQFDNGPLDASIVCAYADGTVNLVVFDSEGTMFKRKGVTILDENEDDNEESGFARWMPYQLVNA